MSGIIEATVNRHCGVPSVVVGESQEEWRWDYDDERKRSVLYKPKITRLRAELSAGLGADLDRLYGGIVGGSLLGGALKIATLGGGRIYGLYRLPELVNQVEVEQALAQDAGVRFFMDAANEWYFGVKDGNLYVYEADSGELECVGLLAPAFEEVFLDWKQAQTE